MTKETREPGLYGIYSPNAVCKNIPRWCWRWTGHEWLDADGKLRTLPKDFEPFGLVPAAPAPEPLGVDTKREVGDVMLAYRSGDFGVGTACARLSRIFSRVRSGE